MRRIAGYCVFSASLFALAGCERSAGPQASWIDPSITRFHPLGWLGARAHPAPRTVDTQDERDEDIAVGGMVVTEVDADGPLAKAGVARGDVIVRVGKTWLPNRDDPSMDLIRAVEAEVSAGVQPLEIGVLRGGKVETLPVAHDMKPMEVGLPAASERMNEIAQAGLRKLVEWQAEDGSFRGATDGKDRDLTACSVAGLAFIAGGAREDESPCAEALKRCRSRVEDAVARDDASVGPWALAWATMFLAEYAGPLEIAGPATLFQTEASPGAGGPIRIHGGVDSEAPPGRGGVVTRSFSFRSDGNAPEGMDLEKLMKEGNVQVMVLGSGAGMPGSPAASAAKTEMPDEPLWSVDQLKMLGDDQVVERLQPLMKAVERLVALQHDAGGWDPNAADLAYSERTLATNQVLLALGMAQRAGAPVAGSVLRRGLEHLRASTHDGHVFAVSDAGFDRRLEAGRSSGAGAALMALNCTEQDEFLRELASYSDKHARSLHEAGTGLPLHVLNTAILRRQRGRETWAVFFEEFRDLIVALHQRDGSFVEFPADEAGPEPLRQLSASESVRTALWTLVAALQGDHAPVLTARAANPLQRKITSDGKLLAGRVPAGGGAQMMDPEQARKMLERMGVNLDEVMEKARKDAGGGSEEDK